MDGAQRGSKIQSWQIEVGIDRYRKPILFRCFIEACEFVQEIPQIGVIWRLGRLDERYRSAHQLNGALLIAPFLVKQRQQMKRVRILRVAAEYTPIDACGLGMLIQFLQPNPFSQFSFNITLERQFPHGSDQTLARGLATGQSNLTAYKAFLRSSSNPNLAGAALR